MPGSSPQSVASAVYAPGAQRVCCRCRSDPACSPTPARTADRKAGAWGRLGDAQKLRRHLWWPWADGVVPFRVEGVGVEVEGCHLLVGDLDALWVGGGVEFAADGQAGLGGGVADEFDDGDAT